MQATDNVDTILGTVRSLSLINYISYNVTDKEFVAFGLSRRLSCETRRIPY